MQSINYTANVMWPFEDKRLEKDFKDNSPHPISSVFQANL